MVEPERIRYLNESPPRDRDYVLYWMQASQRTKFNHALEFAISKANELDKNLIVFFALTPDFPQANLRHYDFMLKGLAQVADELKKRKIKFIIQLTDPAKGAARLAKNASLAITDMGYLNIQRLWRQKAASKIDCPLIQVESDVVVPVEIVSNKREYAARTIRPKINKNLEKYLKPLQETEPKKDSTKMPFDTLDLSQIDKILDKLNIDKTVKPTNFTPGTKAAQNLLKEFINKKLKSYDKDRNDPSLDGQSDMSPYLHFGQISPIEIALQVKQAKQKADDVYLEELIVRRELSMNFTHFTENYDKYPCLPPWSKTTLQKHKNDDRPQIYTYKQLENAQTYDQYWNAAQKQMVITGKMHGYMRMYWGKKIIEWTNTPETAFRFMLELNNKYELDGRDPNSFAGIAWCFGNHDRPWKERPIFGQTRYMNQAGLKRKFDMEKYLSNISVLKENHENNS